MIDIVCSAFYKGEEPFNDPVATLRVGGKLFSGNKYDLVLGRIEMEASAVAVHSAAPVSLTY